MNPMLQRDPAPESEAETLLNRVVGITEHIRDALKQSGQIEEHLEGTVGEAESSPPRGIGNGLFGKLHSQLEEQEALVKHLHERLQTTIRRLELAPTVAKFRQ